MTEQCDLLESSPHQADPWPVHAGGGVGRGGSLGGPQETPRTWSACGLQAMGSVRLRALLTSRPVERFPRGQQNLPSRESCSWSRGSPRPSSVSLLCPRHRHGPQRSGTAEHLRPRPRGQPGPARSQGPGHVRGMNATGTWKPFLTPLWPWWLTSLVQARLPCV